ncbi:MAG: hypothetical protein HY810_03415 [Candidatus Omnitrophica bacterium]|nr:hypothetical protein [Candidatus Omnitrophota bacterium]
MRCFLVFLSALILFSAQNCFAFESKDITVAVEQDKKQLLVSVFYPRHDPRVEFIRKIEVIIDNNVPEVKMFNFQRGTKQTMNVSVEDLEKIKQVQIKAQPKRGLAVERVFSAQELGLGQQQNSKADEKQ